MSIIHVPLPTHLEARCKDLANPRVDAVVPALADWSCRELGSVPLGDVGEYRVFAVEDDIEEYDRGYLVYVSILPNDDVEDSLENQVLAFDRDDNVFKVIDFMKDIYPKVILDSRVIHVTLKTDTSGELTVIRSTSNAPLGIDDLDKVGHLLTIPRVDLSRLRRRFLPITFPLEVVTITPDTSVLLAFKNISPIEYLDPMHSCRGDLDSMHPLLQESNAQYTIDSPYILRPRALVVDSGGFFRGFLMPYHPAGSLNSVLKTLHPDSEVLRLQPEERVMVNALPKVTDAVRRPILDWKIKHAWAIDIVSGLVALHKAGICWGDLKLSNVLLCTDGRCKLIDVQPCGGYSIGTAAPEFAKYGILKHVPKEDVFCLGITLWALCDEIWRFEREVDFVVPHLVWRSDHLSGDGLAPMWYRDLVRRCLKETPEARPTAQGVLDELMAYYD